MGKLITQFGLLALLFLGIFMPELGLAQSGLAQPGGSLQSSGLGALRGMAEVGAALVHIVTGVIIMMMQFMPALWGSELITGPEIMAAIKPMWLFVRNIVNMVFVIMILVVIVMNLITQGESSDWSIRAKLGKIILGLIAVNFSLVMVRVMVDATNVLTVGILSLADSALEARGTADVEEMMQVKINSQTHRVCTEEDPSEDCKTFRQLVNANFCSEGLESDQYCLFQLKEIQVQGLDKTSQKNIMMAFGVHFMRLESLPLIGAQVDGVYESLENTIFSLVMALAYGFAMAIVFVVLVMRVLIMWLMTILSPVIVMAWVLGLNTSGIEELTGRFINYLIVPVKIAVAFSFVFILLTAMHNVIPASTAFTEYIEVGAQLKSLWGDESLKGWGLLWKIFVVAIFWKAITDFAVKGLDETDGIVNGIKGAGEGAGKLALAYGADQIKVPGMRVGENQSGTLNDLTRPFRGNMMGSMAQQIQNRSGSQSIGEIYRATAGLQNAADSLVVAANTLRDTSSHYSGRGISTLQTEDQLLTFLNRLNQTALSQVIINGVTLNDDPTAGQVTAQNLPNSINMTSGLNISDIQLNGNLSENGEAQS